MPSITARAIRGALITEGFNITPHGSGAAGIRHRDGVLAFFLDTGEFRLAYFDQAHVPLAEGRGLARLNAALASLPAAVRA